MTDETMHRPTLEFREQLEWELMRTIRRESRLDLRRRRTVRAMRAAAVVLVSVALGTTAGLASGQIRDNARRDSLLEEARADAAMASLRLDLARSRLADVTKKVGVGMLAATSLAGAETEVRTMEAQTMRARYNIEEITASAQPPRDDLNAPLIGGRDFVKDRIRLDLLSAQQRLTAAEAAQAEAERRVRVGAGSDLASLDAAAELTRARAAMAVLAERLKLRQEFVEKGTPVDQLIRRLEDAQLRQDVYVAQQLVEADQARVAKLEKQHAAGVVDDLEVMKAQVDLKEHENELRRLAVRLRRSP